jgi:toxin-antitoxin system PIN domain toxin
VNVWIALTYQGHIHHAVAARWFADIGDESRLCFCRITQLSLLRLLTTAAVMGSEVLSQAGAWEVYDHWLGDERVLFLDEPAGLDRTFRAFSRRKQSAPKNWADSYLAAFASVSGLTLVTFDQAFRGKIRDLLLLEP